MGLSDDEFLEHEVREGKKRGRRLMTQQKLIATRSTLAEDAKHRHELKVFQVDQKEDQGGPELGLGRPGRHLGTSIGTQECTETPAPVCQICPGNSKEQLDPSVDLGASLLQKLRC